ncbi:MAG: Asp-tRNA(Asn)/Glu-tRNA(Gln) amidotransferase subunit GatC [Acidimicrobiales bacterium]
MAEPISPAEVAHVARLARLALEPDELERLAGELAGVLEHAAEVSALDTAGVPPSSHPLALRNVLRPDRPAPSLRQEEVLAAAPSSEEGRFRVPRVLGEPA